MTMTKSTDNLTLPDNPASLLLENDSLFAVRFLKTDDFIKYCNARDLNVTKDRLDRFEKHNLFTPIFRVFAADEITQKLRFPKANVQKWIKSGALIDTVFANDHYEFAGLNRDDTEAFYSPFQIDWLSHILTALSR